MVNVNNLQGKRCPKCSNEDRLNVVGLATFEVTDDGAMAEGDIEWDNKSYAGCPECGFHGTWGDFDKRKRAKK